MVKFCERACEKLQNSSINDLGYGEAREYSQEEVFW
jgi:hypothetical protein